MCSMLTTPFITVLTAALGFTPYPLHPVVLLDVLAQRRTEVEQEVLACRLANGDPYLVWDMDGYTLTRLQLSQHM